MSTSTNNYINMQIQRANRTIMIKIDSEEIKLFSDMPNHADLEINDGFICYNGLESKPIKYTIKNGHVIGISIENRFVGSFFDFTKLKELNSLRIKKSKFSQEVLKSLIPRIYEIKGLKWLDVNNFEEFVRFNRFDRLSNLNYLDITNNNLTEVPSSIRDLKKLKYLNLGFNYIKKLPDWIGELSNLVFLGIWGTDIVEIPEKLYGFKKK